MRMMRAIWEKIFTELFRNKINISPPNIANGTVKIIINGFETVKTSSPSFLKIIKKLGGTYEIKK